MKHIDDKGHYFCIRAKVNSDAKFLYYDKKEKREIYKKFTDLPIQKEHATYHSIVALPLDLDATYPLLEVSYLTILGLYFLILNLIKH